MKGGYIPGAGPPTTWIDLTIVIYTYIARESRFVHMAVTRTISNDSRREQRGKKRPRNNLDARRQNRNSYILSLFTNNDLYKVMTENYILYSQRIAINSTTSS